MNKSMNLEQCYRDMTRELACCLAKSESANSIVISIKVHDNSPRLQILTWNISPRHTAIHFPFGEIATIG